MQVRLDGLVLLVEISQVGNKILDNVGVGERINSSFGVCIRVNAA